MNIEFNCAVATSQVFRRLCLAFALTATITANAALPSEWEKTQAFDVAAPGLVKLALLAETLNAARAGLEDLRLYDAAGHEVPFAIEHPRPAAKAIQPAKSFRVSLNTNTTVITIETGLAQPLDALTLESPAVNFIKAVFVEASDDGKNWQTLAQGVPVFKHFSGASHLDVGFPAAAWRWLRLTVDDQRSGPVPFTGAWVRAAEPQPTPAEIQTVAITARDENPGGTRLTLDLGAANLNISAIRFDTGEPLFTRPVTIAVPQVADDAIQESVLGQGLIFRIAVEGQSTAGNLSVPLERQVQSRELIVLVHNEDSPPLPISAVSVERRPVYLVFLARQPGHFNLLTGNTRCAAPRYDLAALAQKLANVPVASIRISPPANNPDFHAPEALPGLEFSGAALDISGWKFRKPIRMASSGAQQIELDLDILAHAEPGFADLRILHGSNQTPYIVERTSIRRSLMPEVAATNDAKNLHLSRWIIKLPRANLPISGFACVSQTPLFRRDLSLYEVLNDERGEKYRHELDNVSWTQTPERKNAKFWVALNDNPRSDTLILETSNGDNPPVELEKFTAYYPATRVLFKAKAGDELSLYYGNPRVSSPSYDLSLVAGQLLAAEKAPAALDPEVQLIKSSWREGQPTTQGGMMLWGILAVVVVTLLIIISRLLPKLQPPSHGASS